MALTNEERRKVRSKYDAMMSDLQRWVPRYRDIQTYLCPNRGRFNDQANNADAMSYQNIIDSTPSIALRTLAAGLASGMTSPSRPWFRFGLPDPTKDKIPAVARWKHAMEEITYAYLAKSNIYGALNQVYEECPGFGTGGIFVVEDIKEAFRCVTFTAGEYAISIGPDGRLNGFAYSVWMKEGNLVQEFGPDRVSPEILDRVKKGNTEQVVKVCRLVEENPSRILGMRDNTNMEYRSITWEDGKLDERTLRESGYHEFPFMAPRWKTRDSSATYGVSPGMECLGDIRMLQKMQIKKLLALDKMIDPPMQKTDDIEDESFMPGETTTIPKDNRNGGVKPAYQIPNMLGDIRMDIQEVQNRINKAFYYDLFLMIAQADRPQMTAREIVERHEEKLMALGPVLESLQNELLDPLMNRIFGILARAGAYPPPPEELEPGMDLKIEYISSLAQAQKMIGTSTIEQFTGFVAQVATIEPSVKDRINFDEIVTEHGNKMGVPPKIIRSDDEVEAIRDGQNQAAMEAQQQQYALQGIQAAKSLSETKVGTGNALEALAGGIGAPIPAGV